VAGIQGRLHLIHSLLVLVESGNPVAQVDRAAADHENRRGLVLLLKIRLDEIAIEDLYVWMVGKIGLRKLGAVRKLNLERTSLPLRQCG